MKLLTPKQALNTLLNEAEILVQPEVARSMPQNIDIVLTKACNLACTFCIDYETPGAKRVSSENLEKVAHQLFPTARLVSICSGGEPYLHKRLEGLLRLAQRYNVATWVLSNGMLLNEDRVRTIVREGLITTHGFSVDGYKAETVETLRVNAKLDTILEHIGMLLRVRREEQKSAPWTIVRYALMRSNIEELPDAVERWGKMGIDKVVCNYLAVCNGIDHDESLYFHQELMQKVFAEALRIAAHFPRLRLNLPPTVREEQVHTTRPKNCKAPWRFVKIDTDGRVLPCYRAWEAITMGQVYEDGAPFRDIWNNRKYRDLRRTVNDDSGEKAFSYCSRCDYRYGWGELAQHLGYEEWPEAVAADLPDKATVIDHRRDHHASRLKLPKNAPRATV